MSEAPERTCVVNCGLSGMACACFRAMYYANPPLTVSILPETDEQAFANGKVKALAEAAAQALIENGGGGLTEDTSDRINAALAAMEETP